MITGKQINEKEYRSLDRDSSSSLKEFSVDRRKYKKKYIDQEKTEEEQSSASIIGSIVDCLLFEKDKFDEKFYLSSVVNEPTGNMKLFVDSLLKNNDGTIEFSELIKIAYKDSGYKWTIDKVLEKFVGTDVEIWYKEAVEVKSKGLIVVTLSDIQNAEKIINTLKTNEFTAPILGLIENKNNRYSLHIQFKLDDFEVDNLPMKCMQDLVVIDHKDKTIQIYDLKCTFSVERFYTEYYLYRRSYIQAYIYREAIRDWKSKIDEYEHYKVLNPKFIVCDSIDYYAPLIYTLSNNDMNDAYTGFEYKDKSYPGVKSIIEDIIWSKETNLWNISRKNYINQGLVNIKE